MDLNDLKTPEDLALEWGLTARRVQILCKEGRIKGAVKKGRQWLLPAEVERPERKKRGRNENKTGEKCKHEPYSKCQ